MIINELSEYWLSFTIYDYKRKHKKFNKKNRVRGVAGGVFQEENGKWGGGIHASHLTFFESI